MINYGNGQDLSVHDLVLAINYLTHIASSSILGSWKRLIARFQTA